MDIELLPLLEVQRDLLKQERGPARFQSYLRAIMDDNGEVKLPLAAFNPMSKPHVAMALDRLIAMDAEGLAADAMQQSAIRLTGLSALREMPSYRFGLVLADDAKGGWTNRYFFEAKDRFEGRYGMTHGFITALLWSSEEPDEDNVREETSAAIFRNAWIWVHGLPRTLHQMLRQEGMAARFAGRNVEAVDAAVEKVLRTHGESDHYPTLMACLYGDEAAESLGYGPVGASKDAGLRFAASASFLGSEDPVSALEASKQHRL